MDNSKWTKCSPSVDAYSVRRGDPSSQEPNGKKKYGSEVPIVITIIVSRASDKKNNE